VGASRADGPASATGPQSAYTFLAVADAPRRMIGRLGLVAARLANHLIVDRGNVGIAGLLRRV